MLASMETVRRCAFALLVCSMLPILQACSANQPFSEIAGGWRVSGSVGVAKPWDSSNTLSISVADAASGKPVDAAVNVQAGKSAAIRAMRRGPGTYAATIVNSDNILVWIVSADRTATISLQRQ